MVCRTKTDKQRQWKPVHAVEDREHHTCKNIMTVTTETDNMEKINQVNTDKKQQRFAGIQIGRELVKFQIDCGATCYLLLVNYLMPGAYLESTDKILVMYKSKLRPLGK